MFVVSAIVASQILFKLFCSWLEALQNATKRKLVKLFHFSTNIEIRFAIVFASCVVLFFVIVIYYARMHIFFLVHRVCTPTHTHLKLHIYISRYLIFNNHRPLEKQVLSSESKRRIKCLWRCITETWAMCTRTTIRASPVRSSSKSPRNTSANLARDAKNTSICTTPKGKDQADLDNENREKKTCVSYSTS